MPGAVPRTESQTVGKNQGRRIPDGLVEPSKSGLGTEEEERIRGGEELLTANFYTFMDKLTKAGRREGGGRQIEEKEEDILQKKEGERENE